MRLALSAFCLAVSLLMGCGSTTGSIRFTAKTSTMLGLNQADASAAEAQNVADVAGIVSASITDEPIDPDAFRSLVVGLIVERFSGRDRIIYVAVVDELALLIVAELDDAGMDVGEAGQWIDAAATGVGQGATLYILLLESE